MKEVREIVRKCIQEVFWTEKEWDSHLGKLSGGSDEISALKSEIKKYVESDNFELRSSVPTIMDLAKKTNPESSEYDLVDIVKSILLDLESNDNHMDDLFRNRFNKTYEEFDYMFEKINEIVSAASDSDTDNQLLDPGVSAVATTPTDDEDINENKRKKSHPYVMTLPSGLVYSFDYGIK
tara:strand:+ start:311 stop:850 length:540 start_codon:yes stop_codon:yes gene_type:complete